MFAAGIIRIVSKEYVSREFNCRRIFVIVHRSASDKLAVALLVLLLVHGKEKRICRFFDARQR